jgi:hypothetical protein
LEELKDADKNIYVRGETPESLRKKSAEILNAKTN